MKRQLVVALFTSIFLAVASAVGVNLLSPASAQAAPNTLAACKAAQKAIDASKLPATWNTQKCPVEERMIVDAGVRSVLPAQGEGVHVEALTASGAQELTITHSKNGDVEFKDVGSEAHGAAPGSEKTTTSTAKNKCSDPAYTKAGWRVDGALRYSFNRKTTPRGITRDNAERAIRSSGSAIVNTKNTCRLGDRVSAKAAYLGNTSKVANIGNNGACIRADGNNVVSFGKLPKGTLASACTFFQSQSGYAKVLSSDIKLNTSGYRWTTEPRAKSCSGRYDVASIVTHEFGHTFGVTHPHGNHPSLTMNWQAAGPCDAHARILGRGDVIGLGRIYR